MDRNCNIYWLMELIASYNEQKYNCIKQIALTYGLLKELLQMEMER